MIGTASVFSSTSGLAAASAARSAASAALRHRRAIIGAVTIAPHARSASTIAARIPSDLEVPRVTGAGVGAASGRRTSFRGAGISSVAPTVFRCSANSALVAVVSLAAVAASGAWAVTRRIGRLASVETVSTVASESGMSRPAVDTGVGVSPTPPVVEVDVLAGGTTTSVDESTPARSPIAVRSGLVAIRLPSRLVRLARLRKSGPLESTTCESAVSTRMSADASQTVYCRLSGGNPGR